MWGFCLPDSSTCAKRSTNYLITPKNSPLRHFMAYTLPTHHKPSITPKKVLVAFPALLTLVGLVNAHQQIILNINPRILNFNPYISSIEILLAHILDPSTLFIMRLSTFNGSFIIVIHHKFYFKWIQSSLFYVAHHLQTTLSDLPVSVVPLMLPLCKMKWTWWPWMCVDLSNHSVQTAMVKILDVAPTNLPIIWLGGNMSKANTDNVTLSKDLFECFSDCALSFHFSRLLAMNVAWGWHSLKTRNYVQPKIGYIYIYKLWKIMMVSKNLKWFLSKLCPKQYVTLSSSKFKVI